MTTRLRLPTVLVLVGLLLVLTWAITARGARAAGIGALPPAPPTYARPSSAPDLTFTPAYTVFVPLSVNNHFIYLDDFSNPASGWTSGDNSSRTWGYLAGEYQILLKTADGSFLITPDLVMPSDYRVEVDARQASPNAGSYGLMFGLRYSDTSYEGYQVIVHPSTQEFLLNKRSMDGTWTTLVDWVTDSAIHLGQASNHLRVDRIADSIHVYINGILVATYADSSFTGPGRDAGLRAYSYDTAPVDMRFDNLRATSANLANPLYVENFSLPGRWYAGDQGSSRWSYQGSEYEILVRNGGRFAGAGAPLAGGMINSAVEADMRFADSNLGGYGLLFGIVDWSRFYEFAVYPGVQQYMLFKHTASGWIAVVAPTFSPYINPGTAANHLRIERRGNQSMLYVNGQFLTTSYDGDYVGNLGVGLSAETTSSVYPGTARFDNFAISALGGAAAAQAPSALASAQQPAPKGDGRTSLGLAVQAISIDLRRP